MEAGAFGLHAALPKDTSAEKAGKPCMLGTQPTVLLHKKQGWRRQLTLAFPVCLFLFCWDFWDSTGHK